MFKNIRLKLEPNLSSTGVRDAAGNLDAYSFYDFFLCLTVYKVYLFYERKYIHFLKLI